MSATAEAPFREARPAAFAMAYRMLGSVAEAEDVVQEALLRLHRAMEGGEQIRSPRAYATTVAARLALDELRSARVRRESYVGEWLPEPLVGDPASDPAGRAELSESLSLAFLVLLETLSPEQRAAFLLHDVFDYGFREVAEVLGTSEANARQLAARARRHVEAGRPRFEPSPEARERLAARFFAAVSEGDVAGLEAVLAEDVVLHGDGGGKVPALARAVRGRARVARTLRAWARQGRRLAGMAVRAATVNGQPGAVLVDPGGRVISVMAVDVADGRVQAVRSVVNPDKLRHVGAVADAAALLSRRSPAARSGGGA